MGFILLDWYNLCDMNHKSIPILMYHNIDPVPIGTTMRGLNVRPKLFKSQMWLLKKLGYKG
ncbi:hypothetical protein BSPWISOXPB_10871 [uncultured Gammaproteobacteria bacterium]|nr:hypothetical protein BSPWISOXPB_10871 [uncultured Gammaproteobacteria bacterium]